MFDDLEHSSLSPSHANAIHKAEELFDTMRNCSTNPNAEPIVTAHFCNHPSATSSNNCHAQHTGSGSKGAQNWSKKLCAPFLRPAPFSNEKIGLRLYPSEVLWLKGGSGVGKTSLASHLLGLSCIPSVYAEVQWNPSIKVSERSGIVMQNAPMMDSLTVVENIQLALKAAGMPFEEERVAPLLAEVGLDYVKDGKKTPSELSGGMLRRASLAQVLAQRKRLVVLDEPFVGLGLSAALEVAMLIERMRRDEGVCFVLISHEPHIVAAMTVHKQIELLPHTKELSELDAVEQDSAMRNNDINNNNASLEDDIGRGTGEQTEDRKTAIEANVIGATSLSPIHSKVENHSASKLEEEPPVASSPQAHGLNKHTEHLLQPQRIATPTTSVNFANEAEALDALRSFYQKSGLMTKPRDENDGDSPNVSTNMLKLPFNARPVPLQLSNLSSTSLLSFSSLFDCSKDVFHTFKNFRFLGRTGRKIFDFAIFSAPLIAVCFFAVASSIGTLFANVLHKLEPIDLLKRVEGVMGGLIRDVASDPTQQEMIKETVGPIKQDIYAVFCIFVFVVELAPLLSGLLLTGRIGASYAGELATLAATKQDILLKTIGVSIWKWSVLPSTIASIIAVPLLSWLAAFISLTSCAWAGSNSDLNTPSDHFWKTSQAFLFSQRPFWQQPLVILTYRALAYGLLIIATATGLFYAFPTITPKRVPRVITWAVVLGGVLCLLLDLGFNIALKNSTGFTFSDAALNMQHGVASPPELEPWETDDVFHIATPTTAINP